jgi:hypothetical protein
MIGVMRTRPVRRIVSVLLAGGMLGACSHRRPLNPPDAGVFRDAGVDAASPGALGTTGNLIVNGDAESAAGSSSGGVVLAVIPGWSTRGNANVVVYGASGGYPRTSDPGPANRGLNFLSGGPDDTLSVFTQHIDLSPYAAFITRGNVTFTLSAYLGGYGSQDDNAVLKATFLGATQGTVASGADSGALFTQGGAGGSPLGVVTLGPVLAADRNENTGLLARATTGPVPAQASSVDLELTMTRTEGTANDGYADNLVLTLTDMPQAPSPVDGMWIGTAATTGSTPVGVRFAVSDQSGQLTGQMFVEDPNTGEILRDAQLNGSRSGEMCTWTTETGLVIEGIAHGDTFTGTLTYPAERDFGPVTSNLVMRR